MMKWFGICGEPKLPIKETAQSSRVTTSPTAVRRAPPLWICCQEHPTTCKPRTAAGEVCCLPSPRTEHWPWPPSRCPWSLLTSAVPPPGSHQTSPSGYLVILAAMPLLWHPASSSSTSNVPPRHWVSPEHVYFSSLSIWSVQRTFLRKFFYCFWWRNDFAVTWEITCSYSQFRESETPSCCVSLSTFYNSTIVSCPRCSCGCQGEPTLPTCSRQASPFPPWIFSETHHLCSWCCRDGEQSNFLQLPNGDGGSTTSPAVLCTPHMCPIRVHWHVKENYREYWRVKVTITNFNMYSNYSDWNLVIQHPNFRSILQIFSFNYLPLVQYGEISECSPLRSSIAACRCGWSPDVLLLQMIPRCFGASSITMTCWFSTARTGMCRPRCCCTKTLQTLPSVEAGLFRGGYRSMGMIVSCRRRIRTRRCPTEAPRCPLWFIASPWFSRRYCL